VSAVRMKLTRVSVVLQIEEGDEDVKRWVREALERELDKTIGEQVMRVNHSDILRGYRINNEKE